MAEADIVFTSAGRTTYEVASLGVPCIVLAQNERELTHFFADERNGFAHLGLGADADAAIILDAFTRLAGDAGRRRAMSERMLRTDLRGGRDRVAGLVRQVLAMARHGD
jgi:spore coat polysaccharide biosynthesis predicted glycosyltransferase SpsG